MHKYERDRKNDFVRNERTRIERVSLRVRERAQATVSVIRDVKEDVLRGIPIHIICKNRNLSYTYVMTVVKYVMGDKGVRRSLLPH